MFAFGYAMVPLYYKFCALFGITTARDFVRPLEEPAGVQGRQLRVEFDTNSHSRRLAMIPSQQIARMHTGVVYSISYELRNLADEELRGRAVPSYSPARAGKWVTKLQCFCFEEVILEPGESRRVPVVLNFSRQMPEDIGVVVLSYTFFAAEEKVSAAEEGGKERVLSGRHTRH